MDSQPDHTASADAIFRQLRRGDYGAALNLIRRKPDLAGEAEALFTCATGACWLYLGQYEQARQALSAAFEHSTTLEQRFNMAGAGAVAFLGLLALTLGDPEARDQFAAVQVIERAMRQRFSWLNATWGLGETLLHWQPPELPLAAGQLRRALQQAHAENNQGDILEITTAQAELALRQSQRDQALTLLQQTEPLTSQIEHQRLPAIYRRRFALWSELGDYPLASQYADLAAQLVHRRAATIPEYALQMSYLVAEKAHIK